MTASTASALQSTQRSHSSRMAATNPAKGRNTPARLVRRRARDMLRVYPRHRAHSSTVCLDRAAFSCSLVTMRVSATLPPEAAGMLRPVLPSLADETIAAIAVEVPDYERAMEGEFGQVVRLGVETALSRFVDVLVGERADRPGARETYVSLGRGEFHAGRSLEALLAAYRVGARLTWRRFVEAGAAGGLPPQALYDLGEAIFEYIDELSAESAEGYAEEQSAAAGESQRRRGRLGRPPGEEPPPAQEAVRTAAQAAGWALPRRLAVVVAAESEAAPAASEEILDAIAARL